MASPASARTRNPVHFGYVAIDAAGRRVRGTMAARNEAVAFEQLKRQNLTPLSLRPGQAASGRNPRAGRLSDREAGELLSDLAELLGAGSDMRAALSVIMAKSERKAVRGACRALLAEISGGGGLEQAFAKALGDRQTFIPALIAAGEASGDLARGIGRGAEMLASQTRLRDQLVSSLSYPAFVLFTAVLAVTAILLFVIPALAPLVEQPDQSPPLIMRMLIITSGLVRSHSVLLGSAAASLAATGVILGRVGLLGRSLDWLALHGPFRRTAAGLLFGSFAISIGNMLAAGAPMADALRLAIRSIRSPLARKRIEPVAQLVRQGRALSDCLGRVDGFPQSIVRLAAIGEASGGLGPMLSRAGRLEEEAALRRIEAAGRLIGPALIILLGGLIGLLMGGLLSGVTQIGDSALR